MGAVQTREKAPEATFDHCSGKERKLNLCKNIPAGQIEKRKLVKLNFSFSAPQSLELMRAWVVDTGLVPQVENKHNENQ